MIKKKKFDIKSGHYVILEEDNTTVSTSQPTDRREDNQNKESVPHNKSIETNKDIQNINTELANETKKYSDAKNSLVNDFTKKKQTQVALLNSALADVDSESKEYDSVQTNPNVLSIRKKLAEMEVEHVKSLCKMEIDHAQKVYDIEMKKINTMSKMAMESYNRLPEKYRHLNESNVHNAKIYLDVLVGEDKLMTGMPDFKNAFKDTDLVYGKDKKGYFVLCIDRDDFDKLYVAMNQIGYSRDVIFSIVMSQVLDRSEMIISSNN